MCFCDAVLKSSGRRAAVAGGSSGVPSISEVNSEELVSKRFIIIIIWVGASGSSIWWRAGAKIKPVWVLFWFGGPDAQ